MRESVRDVQGAEETGHNFNRFSRDLYLLQSSADTEKTMIASQGMLLIPTRAYKSQINQDRNRGFMVETEIIGGLQAWNVWEESASPSRIEAQGCG